MLNQKKKKKGNKHGRRALWYFSLAPYPQLWWGRVGRWQSVFPVWVAGPRGNRADHVLNKFYLSVRSICGFSEGMTQGARLSFTCLRNLLGRKAVMHEMFSKILKHKWTSHYSLGQNIAVVANNRYAKSLGGKAEKRLSFGKQRLYIFRIGCMFRKDLSSLSFHLCLIFMLSASKKWKLHQSCKHLLSVKELYQQRASLQIEIVLFFSPLDV